MVKEIQRIRGIQHKSSKKKTKFKGNMNQIERDPFDLLRGMCNKELWEEFKLMETRKYANLGKEILKDFKLLEKYGTFRNGSYVCIKCGIEIGIRNPRQYCMKYYCCREKEINAINKSMEIRSIFENGFSFKETEEYYIKIDLPFHPNYYRDDNNVDWFNNYKNVDFINTFKKKGIKCFKGEWFCCDKSGKNYFGEKNLVEVLQNTCEGSLVSFGCDKDCIFVKKVMLIE